MLLNREMLQFARENDQVAEEIAERYRKLLHLLIFTLSTRFDFIYRFRGYQEIWDNLDMKDVVCYWRKLLSEYAELAQWTVEPIPEYRPV